MIKFLIVVLVLSGLSKWWIIPAISAAKLKAENKALLKQIEAQQQLMAMLNSQSMNNQIRPPENPWPR